MFDDAFSERSCNRVEGKLLRAEYCIPKIGFDNDIVDEYETTVHDIERKLESFEKNLKLFQKGQLHK